uniref:PLAT domain-containing protein n=1 Tax=Romanomermis culicivorax TaxID=13658 RepID=A0A915JJ18_ROMCU
MILPKNTLCFTFDHKNLGILSTLRIGVNNVSTSSKWFLEFVLIRNETTSRQYKFCCGRWFGRGVDDGSLERLLVAEPMAFNETVQDVFKGNRSPPRSRSPSAARRSSSASIEVSRKHYV